MNELHRQMYLAALGVETYMPRWQLPFAPQAIACELPAALVESPVVVDAEPAVQRDIIKPIMPAVESKAVSHVLTDLLDTKKETVPKPISVSAASILAGLNSKPETIEPFSLSVWRPADGIMVIDSRNTKLALPTELLLKNILFSLIPQKSVQLKEDVMRWPMIENSFAKRTKADAQVELQTWLSVQQEIRPIQYLWLMGTNATTYFIEAELSSKELYFQPVNIAGTSLKALALPSLVELLQSPLLKRELLAAVRGYHI